MSEDIRVHIVDDDEAIRGALLFLMKSEGLPTRGYASAEEFLAEVTSATQGCLLLDMHMPGLSGLQLQQQMKQQNIILPVIIMTGYGDASMAAEAMKEGAIDFFEKPFDNEMLLQRVHSCLTQNQQQIYQAKRAQ